MEVDEIFNELLSEKALSEKTSEQFNYADNIVKEIEKEYQNLPDVKAERKKEKESLLKQLHDLQVKLKKIKNVKNYKMVEQNAKKADLRSKIRKMIENVKDKLHAIDLEEKGSEVTSTQLMNETLKM